MSIFDEIRARGVERILYVCVDGLSGMEEAIRTIYPQSHVQRCMVHLVRNSLRFIPTKHYKAFCRDVKAIYGAVSLTAAQEALGALEAAWQEAYPSAVRVWMEHFDQVEQLFELPSEIRRIIYTTNAVEGLHSALRKVTNGKGAFPNDTAVMKALFLRVVDVSKKWTMPISNWALVLGQLSVLFPDLVW